MAPARSAAGLLSNLPALAKEWRLWGEDGRMDGGMGGGIDRHRLLKVKHVCAQTLLRKEKDCPPPCLFDRDEEDLDQRRDLPGVSYQSTVFSNKEDPSWSESYG